MSHSFAYDAQQDVFTIDGIRFAGAVFHWFGFGPVGQTVKLLSREDGLIVLQKIQEGAPNDAE